VNTVEDLVAFLGHPSKILGGTSIRPLPFPFNSFEFIIRRKFYGSALQSPEFFAAL